LSVVMCWKPPRMVEAIEPHLPAATSQTLKDLLHCREATG